ncbi:MAG: FG-GAP repeat protein [Candidatus Hydrogenedentes bacterium]|nr:FG-GAP repeat protein [Candidatus Hydrogenedentota bacterium]
MSGSRLVPGYFSSITLAVLLCMLGLTAHAGLPAIINLAAAPGNEGAPLSRIYGPQAEAALSTGNHCLCYGDFNVDSYDDLAIGIPSYYHSGQQTGAVIIVFGGADRLPTELDLSTGVPSLRTAIIYGDENQSRFGTSVAAGDFNWDWYDDVIIGAPLALGSKGEVFVVYGKASLAGSTTDLHTGGSISAADETRLLGVNTNDQTGQAVAAGNFNGDNYDDIFVGSPNGMYSGNAFGRLDVVYGDYNIEGTSFAVTSGALTCYGDLESSGFGATLAVGEFDGDGYIDAAGAGTGGLGAAVILFGRSGTSGGELLAGISPTLARFHGVATQAGFGSTLTAGDFNADGFGDLVVGAPNQATSGGTEAGSAHVFFGEYFLPDRTIDAASPPADASQGLLRGGLAYGNFGQGLAGGDINADGIDDVMVGVPQLANPTTERGGAVYALDLLEDLPGSTIDFATAQPNTKVLGYDQVALGTGLCADGDMDGDGIADFAMAAVDAENPNLTSANAAGLVTVVYGSATPNTTPTFYRAAWSGDRPFNPLGGRLSPVARSGIGFTGGTTGVVSSTLYRNTAISNLAPGDATDQVSGTVWRIATTRSGWSSARVRLYYLARELPTGATEDHLSVYRAPALDGPWLEITALQDAARNDFVFDTNKLGCFAIVSKDPVIKLDGAITSEIECHTVWVEPGFSASDIKDGDLTGSVSISGAVYPDMPDAYAVRYEVTNSDGFKNHIYRFVTVVDTIAPVITVNGDLSVYVKLGDPYTDAGASASDTCDGSVAVVPSGTVDTQTVGVYTIHYDATDGTGNHSSASRTVTVSVSGASDIHKGDQNSDHQISLSELLRVIQFFNSGGFHCQAGTEDGYAPGVGSQVCSAHSSDYNPQNWAISLSELLRLIQFFNSGGYHACAGSEDGFCVGP